jgi:catechol 2,3-dioxygenase-like lactoylglutathione lyase family enzyme
VGSKSLLDLSPEGATFRSPARKRWESIIARSASTLPKAPSPNIFPNACLSRLAGLNSRTMLTRNRIMAFIPSSDLDRSRKFYQHTLGMRVLYQDDFAVALISNGVMIRVTQVGKFEPYKFTIFGWEVSDIERAVKKLKSKKIEFLHFGMPDQDESGIWTAPSGARIAWFSDPDGNNLSLTQFATKNRKPLSRKKPTKKK